MRLLIILTMFLSLISCGQKQNKFQIPENFFVPVELTRPTMERFITYLPIILRKAKNFQDHPQAHKLTDSDYNTAFYAYLYTDTNISVELIKIGFSDFQSFGSFYNSMLESFVLIQKNSSIVQEAVSSIPKIEKELDILLLKQAREQNDPILEKKIKSLQDYLLFYKNIVLVDQFLPMLSSFNEQK
ncbi:MAG: hypothetical protein ACRCTJ_00650 [Brevinema sp.]